MISSGLRDIEAGVTERYGAGADIRIFSEILLLRSGASVVRATLPPLQRGSSGQPNDMVTMAIRPQVGIMLN